MPDEVVPPADTPPPAGGDTPPPAPSTPPSEPSTPPEAPSEPKSMLEAIDAGLAAIGGAPPAPADDAEPAADDTAPGAKPSAPGKPADAPKPPAKPDEKGEVKPPADPVAKPEKPPEEPKPPPPAPDPVNDPIPPEVKGRTRERMTQLISNIKEVSTERDQYRSERDEILGIIQSTGANPEQYAQTLDYLRAVNSGDPAQIEQAVQVVHAELVALCKMIGKPVPGVDLIAEHSDLQDDIAAGILTRERAEEIAAARAMRATQQQAGQRVTQQRQAEGVRNAALASLTRLGQQLASTDPLYEQKKDLLVPVLKPIFETLDPRHWERAFREAYAKIQVAAPPPPPPPPPPTVRQQPLRGTPQPLRATQPAGNSSRQATSMLDAINAGIEEASARR